MHLARETVSTSLKTRNLLAADRAQPAEQLDVPEWAHATSATFDSAPQPRRAGEPSWHAAEPVLDAQIWDCGEVTVVRDQRQMMDLRGRGDPDIVFWKDDTRRSSVALMRAYRSDTSRVTSSSAPNCGSSSS